MFKTRHGTTFSRYSILLCWLTCAVSAGPAVPPRRELENVAAFARLYGVVRYFYPSDAAASLDWNHFALHGVQRVRTARDRVQLETRLNELFQPLGPGLVVSAALKRTEAAGQNPGPMVAWRYFGIPFGWPNAMGVFAGKRTHRPTIRGAAMLKQTVPAAALRGKRMRLRAEVRAEPFDEAGIASLSVEVARGPGGSDYFDSEPRRIQTTTWREFSVEGTVADDASTVTIYLIASGAVTADFDAVELATRGPANEWLPAAVADAGFEACEGCTPSPWEQTMGRPGQAVFSRPGDGAREGGQYARITPAAANADAELFENAAPVTGAYVDVELGLGLQGRVPVSLTEEQARHAPKLAAPLAPLSELDTDGRWADVVVAWNAFRHFYPYWLEAGVNWDASLEAHLVRAYGATTRSGHQAVLRGLVAGARDGHGRVIDPTVESFACPECPLRRQDRAMLPVRLGLVEGRVVITASSRTDLAPVGAVVEKIGNAAVPKRLAEERDAVSGSEQWKTVRALEEMTACEKGSTIRLKLSSGKSSRPIELPCDQGQLPAEKRPKPITEMSPGIWYVDLTRAQMRQIQPHLPTLAQASTVIFDMRGYPTDAGTEIVRHLLRAAETDRWLHVAQITGPFGQRAGWRDLGFDLKPAEPRLIGKIVFLTDARAISAGDGVMAYVADHKLATIVGSATAGTNGNAITFWLPSGLSISFTGMRVTGHDGHKLFHLRGVPPDIVARPTLRGIREGRDESLERARTLVLSTR